MFVSWEAEYISNFMVNLSWCVIQKLEKVQLGLQSGQKTFDTLRERYSAAIMNQRHCAVLLKDFQVSDYAWLGDVYN